MNVATEELCIQLGRLRERVNQRKVLAGHPDLRNPEAVRELSDAVRVAVRVDVRKALDLAQAAIAIARELRDRELLAFGMRAKANALWPRGDCRSAVRLYRRSVTFFEQAGNLSEVARTLSSSIQSLALLGEYEQALNAAEKARRIFTAAGDTWRVARLDINLANIFHRQNRYREALGAYERAYQQLVPLRDTEAIGVALHNMAVCLIALDNFQAALDSYQRLRELCAREEMPLLVAQADYNVAFLYYLRGEYTRALDLLRATRDIYLKNGDNYHVGLCDLDQSEIYIELSLIDEAAEMASKSLQRFEQLGMNFEQARALINLAIAHHQQHDHSQALDLFARARDVSARENNAVLPNLIDLYRAVVQLEIGQAHDAKQLSISAAQFFRSIPILSKYAYCELVLAGAYLQLGELTAAEEHCTQAIQTIDCLDSPILYYQAHFLRGRIFEGANDPERAYASYQRARSALESLRSSLQRQELKIGFMRNRLDVYTRLTQLCLARGNDPASIEEALSYVEGSKCRTLRDLVLSGTQLDSEPHEQSETEKLIWNLRRELNWYYHRLEREQLSPEGASLQTEGVLSREARAREHELSRILLEMPEAVSVGAALRDSSAAGLQEIRNKLGNDAALIEYFAIGEYVHAAVITQTALRIVALARLPEITRSVHMLQFQLSKFRLDPRYTARFREPLLRSTQNHLRALYDALIAPLADGLNVRDLVVVPFGPLHSLPFHALFDNETYLVDRFNICYEPSATLFHHSHREVPKSKGPSLILGIEDPKLPFVQDELRAVASVLPDAHVLFGPDATEAALRKHGRLSQNVHIASHGIFRQDNPLFSSIRLAGSYLTLYDLYHMNLPVDLLTLSGCVTGLNVVAEGDELLGLTRGLLYAGARSLLLSLWEVEDRSTAEFMGEFYRQLMTPMRKADALRAAMLALRERYAHPYYWAPFKLTGRALAM